MAEEFHGARKVGGTMYKPSENEMFHVHTYRCKHAGDEPDRAYVDKAIELGVGRIVFTDHAPFPGNPFGHRMHMDELPDYMESLGKLKQEYAGQIEILIGFETEYFPSFGAYYEQLQEYRKEGKLDLLVLGQHMYEIAPGVYSFSDEDKSLEYIGLCDAIAQGVATEIFDVVAHPDRSYRRRKSFEAGEKEAAQKLIEACINSKKRPPLEHNYSSMLRKYNYWKEFWALVPDDYPTLYGLDAHGTEELIDGYYRKGIS